MLPITAVLHPGQSWSLMPAVRHICLICLVGCFPLDADLHTGMEGNGPCKDRGTYPAWSVRLTMEGDVQEQFRCSMLGRVFVVTSL